MLQEHKFLMKNYIKTITWFLGVSMFLFGILKFVPPFKNWYTVQVFNSGLGEIAYIMGIAGEIVVGMSLIGISLWRNKIALKTSLLISNLLLLVIIIMMTTSIYVHVHPDVPANVLPLKIKPPYIPAVFIVLAISGIYLSNSYYKNHPINNNTKF